jgi:hypothetical protein
MLERDAGEGIGRGTPKEERRREQLLDVDRPI